VVIEIFSDVVCPWCYIGKRRLDQVLAAWPAEAFEIRWRAFQLYPMLPAQGMPRAAFLAARFGSGRAPAGIYAQVLREAEPLGLGLEFDRIERAPNTFDAHRLLAWSLAAAAAVPAGSTGSQHALAEVLFRFYFCEGRDLGDPEVLADAAAQAGFERSLARAAIAEGAGADAVRADLARAAAAEITGVPLYLLGGRFAIPGAQQPDVLRHFIERARSRLAAPFNQTPVAPDAEESSR